MKFNHPSLYVDYLKSTSQESVLNTLFDGTVTPKNMPWYYYIKLLPMFRRMYKDGEITYCEKMMEFRGY